MERAIDSLSRGPAGGFPEGISRLSSAILCLLAVMGGAGPSAAALAGYRYLSPSPAARQVSPWNNVVIRHGALLDDRAVSGLEISVSGSRSGSHPGRLVLSDDSKTLVFVPAEPFWSGESVSVNFGGGPTAMSGERMPPLTFEFSVSGSNWKQPPEAGVESSLDGPLEALPSPVRPAVAPSRLGPTRSAALTSQPCDSMPFKYLPVTVLVSNNPDPGHVLLTPAGTSDWGLLILDNLGNPLFFRRTPVRCNGLAVQNGLLTYFSKATYWMMDSSYAVIDSFRTGNGYTTDGHDLVLLPNGHALLMAYDQQTVDMSTVVPGGNSNALVIGLIVQELDAAKNVVFQWRSWDHFQITDMVEVPNRTLTGPVIDWVHGNAIEEDTDGNLLICSRHLNEITKIDRQTGDIIWRMGLNAKNNDFTFVNDTHGFSHQHDVRLLPNGHITLFDNGNYLNPEYSRGVEYQLDQTNLIATQVWEYRHAPDIFGNALGSARRLAGGGTIIGWGHTSPDPKVTEVHADGSLAFELGFNSGPVVSYRAIRSPWRTNLFITDVDALDFGTVSILDVATLPLQIHNNSPSPLELTCFSSTNAAFSVADAVPLVIPAAGDATVNVQFTPASGGPVGGTLYVRSVHGSELVAQAVTLTGIGDSVNTVGGPEVGLGIMVFPSPGRGARTLAFATPVAGRAQLQIFDLRGRLVATPFDRTTSAGPHEVTWSGRSDGGDVLASGLYFARLTSPAGERIGKFVNLSD